MSQATIGHIPEPDDNREKAPGKPAKCIDSKDLAKPHTLAYLSRCLRTMALDGFNPITGSVWEFSEHEHEMEFRWIVENKRTTDRAKLARRIAEWIEFEVIAGRFNSIDRLARSLDSGTYREKGLNPAVFIAVSDFINANDRWPTRAEITLPGVSKRSLDLAFQHIKKELGVEIDGRVRWTDPQ